MLHRVLVLVAKRPSMQSTDVPRVRFSSLLGIATWNCGGLTPTQQHLCAELDYGVLAFSFWFLQIQLMVYDIVSIHTYAIKITEMS